MGASPQIFKGFLFGGGIPPNTVFYILFRGSLWLLVILLISDLECQSFGMPKSLSILKTIPIIPYNFTLHIYLMERQDL